MNFYSHAETVATDIIAQFEAGNLPAALANIFIRRNDMTPCRKWSYCNQVLTALAGTEDARGFKQWLDAGRAVKAGAKAFHILAPCTKKMTVQEESTGEDKTFDYMYGLKSVAVFRIEDTQVVDAAKWAKETAIQKAEAEEEKAFIQSLPLIEVADVWGIKVHTFDPRTKKALGYYSHGKRIGVATENIATWAHELIHAADDKSGNITKSRGQDKGNEAVAELGGAVLLTLLGFEKEADLGGAFNYIKFYAGNDKGEAIKLCMSVINRVCTAVALVLQVAADHGHECRKAA